MKRAWSGLFWSVPRLEQRCAGSHTRSFRAAPDHAVLKQPLCQFALFKGARTSCYRVRDGATRPRHNRVHSQMESSVTNGGKI
ncbi:hypothetical protein NDU88_001949 [Pleurodeles waltl]|uniref:Secreted protein n=1 Tax=Pleurodeles waltl TaxID=8319 RepID=A0AAV7KT95_PLEWA|nr:hypothetical protein NDU88_001949 [Pleurodeles waltl]